MENQIADNTTENIPSNLQQAQQMTNIKQQKQNLLPIILLTFIISGIIFGFAGYLYGKQTVSSLNGMPQNAETSLSQTKENNPTSSSIPEQNKEMKNVKTYKDSKYGFRFDYPENYTFLPSSDCSGITDNNTNCLLSLSINPTANNYGPKANFWYLRKINSINIQGQVSNIEFDSIKKSWILNVPAPTPEMLSNWNYTKSGKEIIKSSNGGSQGSSYYYIIPDYPNDTVAIFSIPQSYRLLCDNFIGNTMEQDNCNNFYSSVINQYNKGDATLDSWLPESYILQTYSDAEEMIKSFDFTNSLN